MLRQLHFATWSAAILGTPTDPSKLEAFGAHLDGDGNFFFFGHAHLQTVVHVIPHVQMERTVFWIGLSF